MGYIDINGVSFVLPDGRPLLDEVTFRVGEGSTTALIGPNGAGKSTLLRIVRGDERAHGGAVSIGGGLGVMDQFVGHGRDGTTVHDLLIEVAPVRVRGAAEELEAAELAIIERDHTDTQLRYASALADYADAGGYEHETVWDRCTTAALGLPFERARFRSLSTLSGGEQKRLVLEALLRGPDDVLLLDEPDNYLDVPAKRWLEAQLKATPKTVLLVSHDRELLACATDRIVTLEAGAAGSTAWVHGGSFRTYAAAREERMSRLDELRRRWDEEHTKLRTLVATMRAKATASDEFASRYRAAQTRLARFEAAGPPEERPPEQDLQLRLRGARTGKRAVIAEKLELTGLMKPFDLEVWFGDRVAVLGSNGSGKSHFLRMLARGGSEPDARLGHRTSVGSGLEPVAHTGRAVLGARVVPGWFAQTHRHPEFTGRTLLDLLHRGDDDRQGMAREAASSALDRYGLVGQAQQSFETLSGGQQARFQILLLELSGTTLLLLDEPTDNLDLASAEALELALARFEGTVLAVTHDRWFARSFDRFLVFGADGDVYEADEPVWEEGRVARAR
ncbi:ABC-F family ATP-binding cassette domain-containing protein [Microbacterium rhizomatis]|uniref:ABC-F family ATP-binding cassette domain-containing protein n=1 Tax=Microbacterium rhizomatis TaxID=1631477 RepID=A0A5J5IZL8_9MICO|nr:ATP-binding cassette domain-containing protein [Microbacterium rhizomatis]KAA9107751.1 ABC-F family ATP-binding cassette domain-containing protein [Microbacterium rhizomatis]